MRENISCTFTKATVYSYFVLFHSTYPHSSFIVHCSTSPLKKANIDELNICNCNTDPHSCSNIILLQLTGSTDFTWTQIVLYKIISELSLKILFDSVWAGTTGETRRAGQLESELTNQSSVLLVMWGLDDQSGMSIVEAVTRTCKLGTADILNQSSYSLQTALHDSVNIILSWVRDNFKTSSKQHWKLYWRERERRETSLCPYYVWSSESVKVDQNLNHWILWLKMKWSLPQQTASIIMLLTVSKYEVLNPTEDPRFTSMETEVEGR